jgi:excisionase family DNA binding protein
MLTCQHVDLSDSPNYNVQFSVRPRWCKVLEDLVPLTNVGISAMRPLLRVSEAARRLGLKEATIRKMILEQRILYVKLGRAVRIPEETVDQLIRDGIKRPIQ